MYVFEKDEINNTMVFVLADSEYIREKFPSLYELSDNVRDNLEYALYLDYDRHQINAEFKKVTSLGMDEGYMDEEDVDIIKNTKFDISNLYLADYMPDTGFDEQGNEVFKPIELQ